jgi:hypothetical protein
MHIKNGLRGVSAVRSRRQVRICEGPEKANEGLERTNTTVRSRRQVSICPTLRYGYMYMSERVE